jgi:hypothetical protein
VSNFQLHNVIITVITEFRVYFLAEDYSNIWLMIKDFVNMVLKVLHWLRFDFIPMCMPCLGYAEQNHINPHPVEMAQP